MSQLLKDCTVTGTAEPQTPIGFVDQPANTIVAGPASGAIGPVTARKLVAADIPAVAGYGDLVAANNLSDVANAGTALANLGGTTAAAVAATYETQTAAALLAPLASPALTGAPTAPTATIADNSTKIATTAYADRAGVGAVASVFGRTGVVAKAGGDYAVADVTGAAPLASPALTGVPTAPTAAVDTNTTQVATTAGVLAQAASANPVMDGAVAVGVSTRFARADHVHASDTSRAPLASPALTGVPTAPTAAVDTNTTQVATTAGVLAQAASANPVMNGAVAVGTSTRYARADHVHASDTSLAPLASPALTGSPTAPTQTLGDGSTKVATTGFVANDYAPAKVALTDGATITWATAGQRVNNASVTLAGNRAFSLTGLVAGASGFVVITQDGTGSRTATVTGKVFGAATAATLPLSTAAGSVDGASWYYDGTTVFWSVATAAI
jgi:hypothetical protein